MRKQNRKMATTAPKEPLHGTSDHHWPASADLSEFEQRLADDNINPSRPVKKEISGSWILAFLVMLLILLLVQHWLRQ